MADMFGGMYGWLFNLAMFITFGWPAPALHCGLSLR